MVVVVQLDRMETAWPDKMVQLETEAITLVSVAPVTLVLVEPVEPVLSEIAEVQGQLPFSVVVVAVEDKTMEPVEPVDCVEAEAEVEK